MLESVRFYHNSHDLDPDRIQAHILYPNTSSFTAFPDCLLGMEALLCEDEGEIDDLLGMNNRPTFPELAAAPLKATAQLE